MSTHNICFYGEIAKYQYFLLKSSLFGVVEGWEVSVDSRKPVFVLQS